MIPRIQESIMAILAFFRAFENVLRLDFVLLRILMAFTKPTFPKRAAMPKIDNGITDPKVPAESAAMVTTNSPTPIAANTKALFDLRSIL